MHANFELQAVYHNNRKFSRKNVNVLKSTALLSQVSFGFSRRKNPKSYSYLSKQGELSSSKSPFHELLEFLASNVDTLFSELTGQISGNTFETSATRGLYNSVMLERAVLTLLRVVNDRLGTLWNAAKKETVHSTAINITILFHEIRQTHELFSRLSGSVTPNNSYILGLLKHGKSLLSKKGLFLGRLMHVLRIVAFNATSESIKQYLSQQPREFLVIWSDRNMPSTSATNGSTKKPPMLPVHKQKDDKSPNSSLNKVEESTQQCCSLLFFWCAGVSPIGAEGQVESQQRSPQSESPLFDVLRTQSLDPICTATQLASEATHACFDLNNTNGSGGGDGDGGGRSSTGGGGSASDSASAQSSRISSRSADQLRDGVAQLNASAINATLEAFLATVLSERQMFDESGVYKLFRIILRLQEYVGARKACLQIPAAGSGSKLISDDAIWRKAEAILQTLNEAIFAGELAKKKRKLGCGGGDGDSCVDSLDTVPPSNGKVHRKAVKGENIGTRGDGGDGGGGGGGGKGVGGIFNNNTTASIAIDGIGENGSVRTGARAGSGLREGTAATPAAIYPDSNSAVSPCNNAAGFGDDGASVALGGNDVVLSAAEKAAWKLLATSRGKSGGFDPLRAMRYWRKRHKGTVFVSLQIDTSNL